MAGSNDPIYLKNTLGPLGYSIGDYSYGPAPIVFDWKDGPTLKVGKFCSFAAGILIMLSGNHVTDRITTYPFNGDFAVGNWPGAAKVPTFGVSRGDVVIGNDVWIATGCTILSGVTIGDGAVIGAHAVVARDVPPYSVVVGNPGRVVRKRFSDEVIETLLRVRWWDWPEEKIRKHVAVICSTDVDELVRIAETDEETDRDPRGFRRWLACPDWKRTETWQPLLEAHITNGVGRSLVLYAGDMAGTDLQAAGGMVARWIEARGFNTASCPSIEVTAVLNQAPGTLGVLVGGPMDDQLRSVCRDAYISSSRVIRQPTAA